MNILQNIFYHMDNREFSKKLPDKSMQLIIADPPYYEVKGDFDFIFPSFGKYLAFMKGQAKEYKRILSDNGSLFVYGDAKNIAYTQVIFDRFFKLENNITWKVIDRQTQKGIEGYRSFCPVTERILFYSNETDSINGKYVYKIRDYLRNMILSVRGEIKYKEINAVFGTATNGGGMASTILSLDKSEPAMITEAHFMKLMNWLQSFSPELAAKDYSTLKAEFEAMRRYFNNEFLLTDVMEFSQEGHICAKYDHPTVKPEKLTRALIISTTRPGDTVYIPFGGSGTEGAMCLKEGRNFYGCDIEEKHVIEANERCRFEKQTQKLF